MLYTSQHFIDEGCINRVRRASFATPFVVAAFLQAREWYQRVVDDPENSVTADDIVVALAGNKCDVPHAERQVDFRRADDFARQHGLIHREVGQF